MFLPIYDYDFKLNFKKNQNTIIYLIFSIKKIFFSFSLSLSIYISLTHLFKSSLSYLDFISLKLKYLVFDCFSLSYSGFLSEVL